MPKISGTQIVTVSTAVAGSTIMRFTDQVVGMVHVPAGSGMTSLYWFTAPTENGEYCFAYEVGTNGVQAVAAGRAYQFPPELVGAAFVKASSPTAGTFTLVFKG